ncbi:GIY-YIG nuclease family protein [Terricaulis silvestris]|uniref:Bacteriophage T5 Orf172 DNA-binding domain-containing protein n=1 Tax=Terricaulis silvestris TaxID=2686094 RepID=A0A6I6MQA4_9CAUL|nr:GIY-YIG nuclease family protein [Terricaulis silvestris]QGZ96351.1 hypothetical protein DSM104635_03210 [Terricaulis silvestris]
MSGEFTKSHIVSELQRTASENEGASLGAKRFEQETGIRPHEWQRYWPRFSDAQKEAGLMPNERNAAISDETMLEQLARLTRMLGHRPTVSELRVAKRSNAAIPGVEAFLRMGDFDAITERLRQFALERSEYSDITALLPLLPEKLCEATDVQSDAPFGFVYLLRSGRHYKIGRSNSTGRRERELAIQLPEKAAIVHEIKTDDPIGIEKYWHGRFAEKRLNGEWFALSQQDVSAFRRRKFM